MSHQCPDTGLPCGWKSYCSACPAFSAACPPPMKPSETRYAELQQSLRAAARFFVTEGRLKTSALLEDAEVAIKTLERELASARAGADYASMSVNDLMILQGQIAFQLQLKVCGNPGDGIVVKEDGTMYRLSESRRAQETGNG